MLIMLTTGYCNFFWGGFCHAGYQQALECQGLHSVCIWVTLAEFQAVNGEERLILYSQAVFLKNKKKLPYVVM